MCGANSGIIDISSGGKRLEAGGGCGGGPVKDMENTIEEKEMKEGASSLPCHEKRESHELAHTVQVLV